MSIKDVRVLPNKGMVIHSQSPPDRLPDCFINISSAVFLTVFNSINNTLTVFLKNIY